MTERTAYDLLGIDSDATSETIRSSYLKLAESIIQIRARTNLQRYVCETKAAMTKFPAFTIFSPSNTEYVSGYSKSMGYIKEF